MVFVESFQRDWDIEVYIPAYRICEIYGEKPPRQHDCFVLKRPHQLFRTTFLHYPIQEE